MLATVASLGASSAAPARASKRLRTRSGRRRGNIRRRVPARTDSHPRPVSRVRGDAMRPRGCAATTSSSRTSAFPTRRACATTLRCATTAASSTRPGDRPGARYAWLLERFEETIGRTAPGEQRPGKLALSSYALTDDTREQLKRLASQGVFVSDHSGVSRKEHLPGAPGRSDGERRSCGNHRVADSPRSARVSSRSDRGLAGCRRRSSGSTTPIAPVMTLFENQQYLIQEVYGIPARCPIDFDDFSIPFEGTFDLIIGKHMFTHAVHPRDFLATVRDHLRPGGHLYLYSEFVEAEFLDQSQSMFNTMNPFHMQTFNTPSAVRALEANGFSTVFCTMVEGHLAVLARRSEEVPREPGANARRGAEASREALPRGDRPGGAADAGTGARPRRRPVGWRARTIDRQRHRGNSQGWPHQVSTAERGQDVVERLSRRIPIRCTASRCCRPP